MFIANWIGTFMNNKIQEEPHKICQRPAVRPLLVHKPTWFTQGRI